MAFIKSFCGIIGGATNRPAAADYISYASNIDSLDEILESGYFNDLSNDIYKNDKIWIFNETEWADCRVTSENGVNPVTIVPINSSGGDNTFYAIVGGPYAKYDTVYDAINDGKNIIIIDGSVNETKNILINSTPTVIYQYSQWRLNNCYIGVVNGSSSFQLQINSYGNSQLRINNNTAGAILRGPAIGNYNTLTLKDMFIVNENEINGITLSSGTNHVTDVNRLVWYESQETNGCGIHCQNDNDSYDDIEFIANQSETYNIANFANSRANKIKFTGPFSFDPALPALTTGQKGKLNNLSANTNITTTFSALLGGQIDLVSGDISSSQNINIKLQQYAFINSVSGATVNTNSNCQVNNLNGILITNNTDSACQLSNIYNQDPFTFNGSNAVCSNLTCPGQLTFGATNSIAVGCKAGGNILLNGSASGILSSCLFTGNILEGPGTNVKYSGGNNWPTF